jgi:hypothetical protein
VKGNQDRIGPLFNKPDELFKVQAFAVRPPEDIVPFGQAPSALVVRALGTDPKSRILFNIIRTRLHTERDGYDNDSLHACLHI